MSCRITKAIFPVAGLGSRFLPATKAQPKEMLPIVDKPLIQYAVEEAVASGITDLVFVTGRNKRAIEDHFDAVLELEYALEARGKTDLLAVVRDVIPSHIHCIYIRQPAPLGLGHAVLCAQPVVGDEPFAVLLADDLIDYPSGQQPILAQMIGQYQRVQTSLLAVHNVPRAQTGQYGIVEVESWQPSLDIVKNIIEKPSPSRAPSTLGVVGRYLLSHRIFDHLRQVKKGANSEIQLTDALACVLHEETLLAYHYQGTRYDCGTKLGYLQATVTMGLKHTETKEAFAHYLKMMMLSEKIV